MTTEEPLVLRSDRADGLTTLTLNRPGQFNSLSQGHVDRNPGRARRHRRFRVRARRRHRRCRQGLLRRARPQGNARQPRQGMDAGAVQAVRQADADHHADAAAGDRPRARHRHRRRLPAGVDVRPGGGRRRREVRRLGHQRRPLLLDPGGRPGPQPRAQGGARNAADRRVHRRDGSEEPRAWSTASSRPTRSTPKSSDWPAASSPRAPSPCASARACSTSNWKWASPMPTTTPAR